MSSANFDKKLDQFLVCGLGSLGQHCVVALQEFGVRAIAIEQVLPVTWEIPNLPTLLAEIVVGDCCQSSVLQQANIDRCRAALIVTSNEQVNTEAALAIRQLNAHTRLVVRSTKENLDRLLEEQLGNYVAFDPIGLPASAFALAALGAETLGFFKLDEQWLQVFQRQVKAGDAWCNTRFLWELNSRKRRIIHHLPDGEEITSNFYQWQPEKLLRAKDTLIYLETVENLSLNSIEATFSQQKARLRRNNLGYLIKPFKERVGELWQLIFQQQGRRVALFCAISTYAKLIVYFEV